MGKPTGFMEYTRSLPLARLPSDRIDDWKEFHEHMPEANLREHAADEDFLIVRQVTELVDGMAAEQQLAR